MEPTGSAGPAGETAEPVAAAAANGPQTEPADTAVPGTPADGPENKLRRSKKSRDDV
jgi:hypothetical protein